jgi:hypothetical protein
MKLDMTRLQAAHAAHTAATQELLNANAIHAAAAKAAESELAAAQGEVDMLASEVASQAAAIAAFNQANPAPAAA